MPIMLLVIWFAIFASWTDLALGADAPVAPNVLIRPPAEVPGAVTKQTAAQLCSRGYHTSSERPAESMTEALKKKQLVAWHYANTNPKLYEEDHLISLEIGGDPSSAKNLWPEAYAGVCGAKVKDRLEDRLHALVCDKKIPLTQAQQEIATDWVASYNAHVGKLVCK